jgi:hypothetical protein
MNKMGKWLEKSFILGNKNLEIRDFWVINIRTKFLTSHVSLRLVWGVGPNPKKSHFLQEFPTVFIFLVLV